VGLKSALGYCYWNWGLVARDHKDSDSEREKLERALQIFPELKMPKEQASLQNELNDMRNNMRNNKFGRILSLAKSLIWFKFLKK
jgi:hypothetical protein